MVPDRTGFCFVKNHEEAEWVTQQVWPLPCETSCNGVQGENMSLILSGKEKREGVYLPSYFPLPGSPWSKFAPLELTLTFSSYIKWPPQLLGVLDPTTWCVVFHPSVEIIGRAKNSRWVLVGVGIHLQLRGKELRLLRPLVSLSQGVCQKGEQVGDGCWG